MRSVRERENCFISGIFLWGFLFPAVVMSEQEFVNELDSVGELLCNILTTNTMIAASREKKKRKRKNSNLPSRMKNKAICAALSRGFGTDDQQFNSQRLDHIYIWSLWTCAPREQTQQKQKGTRNGSYKIDTGQIKIFRGFLHLVVLTIPTSTFG